MAKFFVGQKVRMVDPVQPVHYGFTGVIIDLFPERMGIGSLINCDVRWDQELSARTASSTHTIRLEPILDAHEPCESDFKESLDKLLSEVRDGQTV